MGTKNAAVGGGWCHVPVSLRCGMVGSCHQNMGLEQHCSWMGPARVRVSVHGRLCRLMGSRSLDLPERDFPHEHQGESHVHFSVFAVDRQLRDRVHHTASGEVHGRQRHVHVLLHLLWGCVSVCVGGHPETKGLRLEEMTDLFGELPEVLVSAEGMEGSMKHVGMAGSISSSCSFTTAFRQIEKSASVPASGHHGSSSAASMRRLLSDGGAPSGLPMPVVRSRICMAPGGHVALY